MFTHKIAPLENEQIQTLATIAWNWTFWGLYKALWGPFLSLESSSSRKAHHCPHTEHAQLACLGNRLFWVVSNFPHSTWSMPGSVMLYVLTVGHCFVPSYPFLKMHHILFSILLLMVSILQNLLELLSCTFCMSFVCLLACSHLDASGWFQTLHPQSWN